MNTIKTKSGFLRHCSQEIFSILLLPLLLFMCTTGVKAQCDGSQDVPAYSIDLEAIPDGFMSGEFRIGDECCSQMQGNNSCLYFDITVGTRFVGIQMCFDPPCSITGYYGASPAVGDAGEEFTCISNDLVYAPEDEADLCRDILCIPDPTPTVVRLLVCAPGVANNPLGLDIIGIPEIELNVDDVAVGCNTQFQLGGAVTIECGSGSSPPKIVPIAVAWSNPDGDDPNLDYLSCTNCVDPIFEYSGPPIMDCAGLKIDYTASIPFPPNECSVPAPVTKTATVFPEISGELIVNRACTPNVIFSFVPLITCDYTYEWYDSAGVLQPETGSTISRPGDPNETYCIHIKRLTTPFCDPVVLCASAFCCDAQVGVDCW